MGTEEEEKKNCPPEGGENEAGAQPAASAADAASAPESVETEGGSAPAEGTEGAPAEGDGKRSRRAHRANIVVNIVAAVLLLGVFIFIFVYFYDDFQYLGTPEGRNEFIERLRGTGFVGVLILLLIQILQVVVAFIPGEIVELASGALYGTFGGLVLCLVGLNIGTLVIFGLVRLLGGAYVRENVSQKQYKYLKILNDPDRALVALFFIFLIPGIPKDILIYFIPQIS